MNNIGVLSDDPNECVRFSFEDYDDAFTTDVPNCSILAPWRLDTYDNTMIEAPNENSVWFITPSDTLSCTGSFDMTMMPGALVEVKVYLETSATDVLVVNLLQRTETGSQLIVGSITVSGWATGWQVLRLRNNVEGNQPFQGFIVFMGSALASSVLIVDSFRYVPLSMNPEEECIMYEHDTTIPTTIFTTEPTTPIITPTTTSIPTTTTPTLTPTTIPTPTPITPTITPTTTPIPTSTNPTITPTTTPIPMTTNPTITPTTTPISTPTNPTITPTTTPIPTTTNPTITPTTTPIPMTTNPTITPTTTPIPTTTNPTITPTTTPIPTPIIPTMDPTTTPISTPTIPTIDPTTTPIPMPTTPTITPTFPTPTIPTPTIPTPTSPTIMPTTTPYPTPTFTPIPTPTETPIPTPTTTQKPDPATTPDMEPTTTTTKPITKPPNNLTNYYIEEIIHYRKYIRITKKKIIKYINFDGL